MDNIPQDWLIVFAGAGIIAIGFILYVCVAFIFVIVKEKIIFLSKRYRDKHFLEHPPEPQCYCIQCNYWHRSNKTMNVGFCEIWEKYTTLNEACLRGALRTEEGYKNEEFRMETDE